MYNIWQMTVRNSMPYIFGVQKHQLCIYLLLLLLHLTNDLL